MKNICVVVVFALLLSSCASNGGNQMSRGGQGGIGGGAAGALIGQAIGKSTEATLIGAALGAVLGYAIGNEMDKADEMQLNNAYERGASGRQVSWVNPDSGNRYNVVPQPAYRNSSTNEDCRQAEIEAIIDGQRERTFATACRNSYGQWELKQ